VVLGWDPSTTKIWLYYLNGYGTLIMEWQEAGKNTFF
jgi:hypothetical protein